ncbi:hypothetical protein BVI1335_190021 [Burkholderia vietnamiensis]|nr:hypothetical protein BVI1335_190021 [Burkholderia vietnamiensis]
MRTRRNAERRLSTRHDGRFVAVRIVGRHDAGSGRDRQREHRVRRRDRRQRQHAVPRGRMPRRLRLSARPARVRARVRRVPGDSPSGVRVRAAADGAGVADHVLQPPPCAQAPVVQMVPARVRPLAQHRDPGDPQHARADARRAARDGHRRGGRSPEARPDPPVSKLDRARESRRPREDVVRLPRDRARRDQPDPVGRLGRDDRRARLTDSAFRRARSIAFSRL